MGRRTGHGRKKARALFVGFELRSEGTLSCWLPTVEKKKTQVRVALSCQEDVATKPELRT